MICEQHRWRKNGTVRGKQRYQCAVCKKTCSEMDLMEKNKLLNLALELINSFPNEEDYVWEEAVEYDDEGNEQEAFCSYKYKVEKVKIPWTNFKKMVDSKKRFNKPLAVFLSEINPEKDWREETLIVYEVY